MPALLGGLALLTVPAVVLAGAFLFVFYSSALPRALAGLEVYAPYLLFVIGVALAVTFLCAGRRVAIRQAIIGGAIRVPWLIFAQLYYGSIAPQSVMAKSFAYAHFPWSEVLHHHLLFWSYQPHAWFWWLFAAVGAVALVRREPAWVAVLPTTAWR